MSRTRQTALPIPEGGSTLLRDRAWGVGRWVVADKGGRVKTWLKVLAPVMLSVLGLSLLRLLGPDVINQQELRALLKPLGPWAPLCFVLALTVRPLVLMPGQLFTAVGGMVFGTRAATLYCLLGSFLSSALLFLLAQRLGAGLMKRLAGPRYPAITRVARRHGFKFALLTCINPLLPTDVMIIAAAASGARFWPVTLGVLVGTIPGTFLTAEFGSGLAQGRTWATVASGVGMVVSLVLGAVLGRRIFQEINQEQVPEEDAAALPAPQKAPAPVPALATVQEPPAAVP